MNVNILQEVKEAYIDSDLSIPWEEASKRRKLDFKSSDFVLRDVAYDIMIKCVSEYNDFTPEIIKKFPSTCLIQIAREGSVCLYVKGKNLPTNIADEESWQGDVKRYWWD